MVLARWMGLVVAVGFLVAASSLVTGCGGGGGNIDGAYESCYSGDVCDLNLDCLPTTLPESAGYTGALCTSTCATSADCAPDLTGYTPLCVNAQCYTQCPDGGATCPYGTTCLQFSDQDGNEVDLCTP
jgi:hypothetical protein